MDLKSMLNEGAAAAAAAGAPAAAHGKPPPRPASQHHHHPPPPPPQQQQQQQQHLPSTPIQTVPSHSFHDHPQSTHPSPVRAMSHDFHPAHQTPFASPPPYGHAASTPYAAPARPPPPPLQQLSTSNVRSPSTGSVHVPASPYSRATPNGPVRQDSAGYPFPSPGHPHTDYASPVQAHRYPPSAGPYAPQRESYSQPSGHMASPGPPGHHPPGYFPPQHAIPQTPPVGTPGINQPPPPPPPPHQRTASGHSQHAYPPYASPIATNHPPPPSEHGRQHSQPATPLAPPISTGPRQQQAAQPTFAQPQSPYQHRTSSTSTPYPQYPQQQPHQQPSPHVTARTQPSPRPPIQRPPSVYEQAVDPQRRSLSHSERERSVSVSPKTRVPSLPSSVGHLSHSSFSGPSGQPPPELDPRDPRHSHSHLVQMRDAPVKIERENTQPIAIKTERSSTPAKRKLDDRDIKPEELDRQEPRPPPFETNGSQRPGSSSRPMAGPHTSSPMLPRRKARHTVPPMWARPYDRQPLKHANFHLRKPATHHAQTNGKTEAPNTAPPRQERAESRHVSPEASRANPQAPPANQPPPPVVTGIEKPRMLGPWEATIANQAPMDEMIKTVADFLFMTVINHAELSELHGRHGIQYEVEAKLGALIDKSKTGNMRFQLPIASEAVLVHNIADWVNFSSSMTEAQHKGYNQYLNSLVADASPQNPKNRNSSIARVPVNYVHLRETDRFYKLSEEARNCFHPVLLNMMRRDASLRVTREQKTGQVVAKIVKVKVADLHLMFPQCDLDCRITVNVEATYDGPVEQLEQIPGDAAAARAGKPDRHKDRLSYTQGNYKVDLTQVTQPDAGGQIPSKKVHELEIELNTDAVIEHGRRAMRGEPHNYDFLVEGFVNNIRLLARKAREVVSAQ